MKYRANHTRHSISVDTELSACAVHADIPNPTASAVDALLAAHRRLSGLRGNGATAQAHEFEFWFRTYLDHAKLEVALPLCKSAPDLVLMHRRMRMRLSQLVALAQREVGPVNVFFNNSSRFGKSWGSHLNFLVHRKTFDLFLRNECAVLMPSWVPWIVTSAPIVASGKLGSENGSSPATYQLTQRADFIDRVVGHETVETKSIVNTRDESHMRDDWARFHCISLDGNRLEFASFLKFGISSVLLGLIEEGFPVPDCTLADPLAAVGTVSRDLSFEKPLTLADGRKMTALDIQRSLAEAAARAMEAGSEVNSVPYSDRICALWLETLDQLNSLNENFGTLARRLDWAARFKLIRTVATESPGEFDVHSAADVRFGELGVVEELEQAGAVDMLEDFLPDTAGPWPLPIGRDQLRGALLGRFGTFVVDADWSVLLVDDAHHVERWTIRLDEPEPGGHLLDIVKSASDWETCLKDLARHGIAQRVERGAATSVLSE